MQLTVYRVPRKYGPDDCTVYLNGYRLHGVKNPMLSPVNGEMLCRVEISDEELECAGLVRRDAGVMTQKTYTQSEFGDLLDKARGGIEWFRLKYPSDPRCQFKLWLEWKDTGAKYASTRFAEDVDDVSNVLKDPTIISLEWHRDPVKFVTIVRKNKEKANESVG